MDECAVCVNNTNNPTVTIAANGLCNVCTLFRQLFSRNSLKDELDFFKSVRGEVFVGLSGGKDSTAATYLLLKMGFRPRAFTFDLGYYPPHIFGRAASVAAKLQVPHEVIDIRHHIRPLDHECYRLTSQFFEDHDSPEAYRSLYVRNRQEYSAKSVATVPFVRACQLCRRTVIRAYYAEAVRRGISVVVLGMNEWAGLSGYQFTAIRKLQPSADRPAVYVVHLPFLLGHTVYQTAEILDELDWRAPDGEVLVESNANSCLFAMATEERAKAMLGFHPDSTRLSREVTVGFITRDHAKNALSKPHPSDLSVRQTLEKARVLPVAD